MLGIFLDIESTGLDPSRHCAIDIAFKIIDLCSGELKRSFNQLIEPTKENWEKRDPVSMKINGYSFECLFGAKNARQVGEEIVNIFTEEGIERGKAVFICQNPSFDRTFFAQLVGIQTQEKLLWPYHWLDLASMYWALLVRKQLENGLPIPDRISLSKNDIARAFHLEVESDPHRAINGVNHLIVCYQAVLGVQFSVSV